MYYLETNSLISLKNKLQTLALSRKCYTSSLTIVEILKYMNERSFYVKRNLLLALRESTIRIDWDLPSYKSFSAFPASRNTGDKSDELKTIHAFILSSKSYEEFLKKQEETKIQTTIETISKYCGFFDSVLAEALSAARQMVPDVSKRQGKELFNFLTNNLYGIDTGELKNISRDSMLRLSLDRHSWMLALSENPSDPASIFSAIRSSYNGSLDAYFEVSSFYTLRKLMLQEDYRKNDTFDLTHFMYLQNRACKMTSDDNLVKYLARELLSGRARTVAELSKKLGIE